MSLSEFLHMDGYAGYVWSCYGLTAAVLIAMEWMSRRDLQAAQRNALRRVEMSDTQP